MKYEMIRSLTLAILILFAGFSSFALRAAEDNWTLFQKACATMEQADSAAIGRDYPRALALYQDALKVFESIRETTPNWNRNVMSYRIALSKRKISSMERSISEQKAKPVLPGKQQKTPSRTTSAIAEARELRAALESARKQLDAQKEELLRGKKALEQVEALSKERIRLEKEISSLRLRLETMENQGKDSPLLQEQRRLLEAEQKKSASLQVRLTQASQRAAEMEKKLAEIESVSAKAGGAEQDLENLTKKLEAANADLARLYEQNQKLQASNKQLAETSKRERDEAERRLAERSRECERLLEDVRRLRSGKDAAEFDKDLTERYAALKKENDELTGKIDRLSRLLDEKTMELGAAQDESLRLSNALADLSKRNEKLTESFETLKLDRNALETELQTARSEQSRTQVRIKELEAELTRFAEKINAGATMDSMHKELVENLRKELEAARAESARTQEKRDQALKDLNSLQTKFASLSKDAEAFKETASEREKDVVALKTETEKMKSRIAELEKRPDASAEEVQKMQKRVAVLSDSLADAQSELKRMQEQLEDAQKKASTLEAGLAEKEKAETRISSEHSAAKAEWEEKTNALRKELDLLKVELANAKADREKLLSSAEKDWKNAESLAKDNSALKQQISSLEFQLNEQKNALEKRSRELDAANALLKDGAAEELAESRKKSEDEIAALKAQIARLSVPDDAQRNAARLKQLNEIQEETIAKLNKEKIEAAEQRRHLEQNLISTQAQLEKIKIDMAANPDLKQANLQLRECRNRLEQAAEEKKKLEESLKNLDKLHEELKIANQALSAEKDDLISKIRRMDMELDLYRKNPNAYGLSELKKKNETIEALLQERKAQSDELLRLRSMLDDQKAATSGAKKEAAAMKELAQKAIDESDWLRSELESYVKADPNAKKLPPKTALPSDQREATLGDLLQKQSDESRPLESKPSSSESEKENASSAQAKPAEPNRMPTQARQPQKTAPVVAQPADETIRPAGKSASPLEAEKKMREELAAGERLENANELNDALWRYLQAADVAPENPEPQFALARLHLKMKQPDRAQRAYEKALRLGGERDRAMEERIENDVKNMPKPEF